MPPGTTFTPVGASTPSASKSKLVPIQCIPGLGVDNLSEYVGQSVEHFCAFGYGKKKDPQNHCAHFVSHALNIQIGAVCSGMLDWKMKTATDPVRRSDGRTNEIAGLFTLDGQHRNPFKGASIRVDEIYNFVAVASKGSWDSRPDTKADCLIYVTRPANLKKDGKMGQGAKHIGIHHDGSIYHYGNTADGVSCDTIEKFQTKMRGNYGKDAIFLLSAIPHVEAACVHRGASIGK